MAVQEIAAEVTDATGALTLWDGITLALRVDGEPPPIPLDGVHVRTGELTDAGAPHSGGSAGGVPVRMMQHTLRSRRRPADADAHDGRGFPEGKTYGWFVVGFLVCHYLFTSWLRAIGLDRFADEWEPEFNAAAPYLLLPLSVVLVVQTLRRSLGPALVVAAGSLTLHYFFYVHFVEWLSWASVALIGLGVTWSYVLASRGAGDAAPPANKRRLLLFAAAVAYVIGTAVALGLKVLLERAELGGRLGDELPVAVAVLPALLALAVYLAGARRSVRGSAA